MRFADILIRGGVLAVLCAGVSGCATLAERPAPQSIAAGASSAVDADVSPAVRQAFERARRALQAGRVDEAERRFRALARSYPELGGPHANLGMIYRHAGKLSDAVAELEQAVRLSPRQPVFFNQLGITYRQQGQFRKARDAYERAIALDPNYAAAYLNLGILCDLYLWDASRALEMYDRYLALAGSDDTVNKWVVDIRNRNRQQSKLSRKEQE
jgi:Flp pilus assembly protein TadD